jgi:PAS domain S-box-containing protein
MTLNLGCVCPESESLPLSPEVADAQDDKGAPGLLLQAFEMFTQASSSLEAAFQQLQARAQRLSEELETKNQELKRSLAEKDEVQNYLKTILESLPCGVLVLDDNGKATLCNPLASEIFGGLGGKESSKGRKRGPALQGASLRKYFTASVSLEDAKKEVEIPFVSGSKMRILATSGTPLNDAAGRRIGTLHIIRDITEMKVLEEQGKRIERLSAMGEMAVELAHEIRNPLGSIELFASLLEKELADGSDLKRWAENIRIGSHSLNNIVSNMLHFANPLSPAFMEVDAHEVIQEILRFVDPIMKQRDVNVVGSLMAKESIVRGDRELLKQMILNLILNAMQAMPSQGSLSIATREVNQLPGGAQCPGIELRIRDTGLGIPPENLSRIFDPFFTTNKNGTGLGLSVVHQIVDRHSGFIAVQSEVNKGTTFTIVLPRAHTLLGAA